MRIVKHGRVPAFVAECSECGAEFEFALSEARVPWAMNQQQQQYIIQYIQGGGRPAKATCVDCPTAGCGNVIDRVLWKALTT